MSSKLDGVDGIIAGGISGCGTRVENEVENEVEAARRACLWNGTGSAPG